MEFAFHASEGKDNDGKCFQIRIEKEDVKAVILDDDDFNSGNYFDGDDDWFYMEKID